MARFRDPNSFRALLVGECDTLALSALNGLIAAEIDVVEIWTTRPELFRRSHGRAQRGRLTGSTPHREPGYVVRQLGIPFREIKKPYSTSLISALENSPNFDFLLCAGSYIIFPESFLNRLQGRAFNLHPALLPHYRGPRPLYTMVFEDTADTYGGMTLHQLTTEIDEGPIVGQRHLPASDYIDFRQWVAALQQSTGPLIQNELIRHLRGELPARPQPAGMGSYRSVQDVHLEITIRMDLAAANKFIQRAPLIMTRVPVCYIEPNGRPRKLSVRGVPKRIGPAIGTAPKLSPTAIELDLADCRVRIRRDRKITRLIERFGG